MKKTKRVIKNNKTNSALRFELIPGIILFALLPIVAGGKLVETGLDGYSWFSDEKWQYDFFMYWKSVVFLILVIGMVCVLLDRFLLQGYRDAGWKKFLPLAGYAALAVLSAILSVNRTLSLKGMWQQYENIWVLLGYGVTVCYFTQVIRDRKDVYILLAALCVGAVFQAALGLTQLMGNDFFSTQAGRSLLTLGLDDSISEKLRFDFAENEQNKVYMGSYHPNYAAVYVIAVWPVLFYLGLTAQKKWRKVVSMVTAALLLLCLAGSGSKTGMLVLGVQILIMTILRMRKSGKTWVTLIAGVVFAAVLILYDVTGGHILSNALIGSLQRSENYDLEEIIPEKDSVRLRYKGYDVSLSVLKTDKGDTMTARDEKKGMLPVAWNMEKQCFKIQDKDFKYLRFDAFVQDETAHIYILYDQIAWHFQKEKDSDSYVYITQYGKEGELSTAQTVLKGWEKALTGRGYIWGRTIPLLKKYLLWGSGPDTFIVEFPQTDYVMRANTSLGMFVDIPSKAHSLYLQTSLQTGILSLICLLVFWGRYLKSHMTVEKKQRKDPEPYIGTGIFLGIAGYLLMGCLNDSVLAVAPIFWGLLGLGMAADRNKTKYLDK